MSDVKQEEDTIASPLIIAIGAISIVVFAIGILWSIKVQKGMTGSLKNNTAPKSERLGRREIGMVYQPVFDRGHGIAADHNAPILRRLDSYGWADDQKTAVHIPIDRAMQLVVERNKL
jgi:hypothetical protein